MMNLDNQKFSEQFLDTMQERCREILMYDKNNKDINDLMSLLNSANHMLQNTKKMKKT